MKINIVLVLKSNENMELWHFRLSQLILFHRRVYR